MIYLKFESKLDQMSIKFASKEDKIAIKCNPLTLSVRVNAPLSGSTAFASNAIR